MANWCSNTVEFKGDANQLASLKVFFEQMAAEEKRTRHGQLPDFTATRDYGYLFEISWENDILTYETKWAPNAEVLVQIADKFQTGFLYTYCEPGMVIYGEAVYEDGHLKDIYLEDDDLDRYSYDEKAETYTFENREYDSEYEILDTLLEQKKDALNNNNGLSR